METFQEILLKAVPDINLEHAKTAITLHHKYMFDFLYRELYCEICLKILDKEEVVQLRNTHYNICCKKHADFANKFNVELIRSELGLTFEDIEENYKKLNIF